MKVKVYEVKKKIEKQADRQTLFLNMNDIKTGSSVFQDLSNNDEKKKKKSMKIGLFFSRVMCRYTYGGGGGEGYKQIV